MRARRPPTDPAVARWAWLDPGPMVDGDLELVLAERAEADPALGHVPAYRFLLVRRAARSAPEVAGRIELRVGTTPDLERYAGHVGYSVAPPHRGRRLAARAVRLLLPLARRHGMATLWITCNPDNAASRRTCELVGALHVETVPLPKGHVLRQAGDVEKCRYRLDLGPG
ncbi:MAG TPA: GNAT family N-acetyltransferase [Planctomycetota bacterium]|nr:GNAT family N-acetyltransferase [Planctomycetota bacterium]